MAGIAGIVSLAGALADAASRSFLARLGRENVQIRSPGALFAFLGSHSHRRREDRPSPDAADYLGVADARLANRSEIGTLLSLSSERRQAADDGTLLIDMHRRFGAKGVARALGAFAFAAWDEAAQRLVLGRDCLGERTLYFHHADRFVVFASDMRTLLSMPLVPRVIDDDAVANYLAVNLWRPSKTLYRGIERVASRTLVTIDPGGVCREHYWSPDFAAPRPFKKQEDYIERARELFDQAVLRTTQDTPHIAVSLSGGLDSSAIAATAVRLGRAQSIACYTVIPPEDFSLKPRPNRYFSERDKVEAFGRMYPALKIEFCEEGKLHPLEEDPNRFFLRAAAPHLNPWLLGSFSVLDDRVVSDGYAVLQDGRMGNLGLSWDGSFSLLTLLRERRLLTLARDFARESRKNRRGVLRTFFADFVAPTASRRQLRALDRLRGRNPDDISDYSFLNPSLVRQFSRDGAWEIENFYARSRHSDSDPAKHRAMRLFDQDQFARDIRASSQAIFGFELRDPHADRPLLEFLLQVPEWYYRHNGVRRSFARKVLADRLPPEILDDTSMGVQGVTWFRRMDARRAAIAEDVERMTASPTARRLIDVPRMKRIVDDWPKDAQAAEDRRREVRVAFGRAVQVGQFVRWVEGGNG